MHVENKIYLCELEKEKKKWFMYKMAFLLLILGLNLY